jgi:hypothetical protein
MGPRNGRKRSRSREKSCGHDLSGDAMDTRPSACLVCSRSRIPAILNAMRRAAKTGDAIDFWLEWHAMGCKPIYIAKHYRRVRF